jgi:hypothetical protein
VPGLFPTDPAATAARTASGLALLNETQAVSPAEELPASQFGTIGRYRIEKLLGKGGYGAVYLGYDDGLRRLVAIKVPLKKRVATAEQAEADLAEVRLVASLDHPHIVPVYDVGRCDDGLFGKMKQPVPAGRTSGTIR